MEQILVVDDEAAIGELIGVYLQNEGYRVFVCENAREALECIDKEKIDLVLLDVMLPDQSGFDVCRKIRENHNYPVIMLTARDQEIDKITGLTLGADDYITKPFRPLELIARVKAQLRRFIHYNPGQEDRDVAEVSGLRIDCRDHTCTLHGKKPVSYTHLGEVLGGCHDVTAILVFYEFGQFIHLYDLILGIIGAHNDTDLHLCLLYTSRCV